jgi:hypothetical protein
MFNLVNRRSFRLSRYKTKNLLFVPLLLFDSLKPELLSVILDALRHTFRRSPTFGQGTQRLSELHHLMDVSADFGWLELPILGRDEHRHSILGRKGDSDTTVNSAAGRQIEKIALENHG